MDESDRIKGTERRRHSRRIWAVCLTALVIIAAASNVIVLDRNPLRANLQDFGQWLSGVAGALAFVWLVIGYLQQAEELELQRAELRATREQLALQRNEMKRAADEAEKQARAVSANEQHIRRDIYIKTLELLEAHLFELGVKLLRPFANTGLAHKLDVDIRDSTSRLDYKGELFKTLAESIPEAIAVFQEEQWHGTVLDGEIQWRFVKRERKLGKDKGVDLVIEPQSRVKRALVEEFIDGYSLLVTEASAADDRGTFRRLLLATNLSVAGQGLIEFLEVAGRHVDRTPHTVVKAGY